MIKHLMAATLAAACLFVSTVSAQESNPIDALPWQAGPMTGKIGNNATIEVPAGYKFLGPAGAKEFNRLTENPSPDVDEYLLAKQDYQWIAFFSFSDVGYVKDDEKLDADDLLKSTTEGTEESNKERKENGWRPVHVTGWAFKPQYDKGLKSLEWAFRLKGEGQSGESINYNTRLLGRRGVIEVLVLTTEQDLQASVADFKTKLPGFAFNPGEKYAEFRDGDRIAEYGLAALVTGGAAAVAAKKGLFGVIGVFLLKMWKLALIGIAAVGAAVKKFFQKKQPGTVE
ncbi:DUF2167 domain-containing protein [Lysobacter sp. KIS68-7]|uniref:DUF2167 domain-containing protein n=1 Tax=Lysobacter sp. KIS68-7 TaxID=2904252 RepID=UPI001E385A88|nr:DUF2167 domain-containing protein [Lysobacter sp. KIS68-7]UHQ19037.1 DUF2167 domain-containing protein [Lysobacter sp. KIS68-7]